MLDTPTKPPLPENPDPLDSGLEELETLVHQEIPKEYFNHYYDLAFQQAAAHTWNDISDKERLVIVYGIMRFNWTEDIKRDPSLLNTPPQED